MNQLAASGGNGSGPLEVHSAVGSGTEIELRIPSAIASTRWSWWSRLLRTHSLLGSLLLAASLIIPTPTFAAPATDIRVVRVPVVTGSAAPVRSPPMEVGALRGEADHAGQQRISLVRCIR